VRWVVLSGEGTHDAQQALPEHDRGVGPGRRAGTAGEQGVERGAVGPDRGRPAHGRRVEQPDDRLRDRPVAAPALHRAAAEHQQPGVGRCGRGGVEQPGLAHPRFTDDGKRTPAPGRSGGHQPTYLGQLAGPAHDHRAAQHGRHDLSTQPMHLVPPTAVLLPGAPDA
jgi:hypothetical protein